MSIHAYEYLYVHFISMSTSETLETLNRFDLEIYKVGYQECIDIDGDVTSY
jgi:hypothetical protein